MVGDREEVRWEGGDKEGSGGGCGMVVGVARRGGRRDVVGGASEKGNNLQPYRVPSWPF